MTIVPLQDLLDGYGSGFEFETFVLSTLENSARVDSLKRMPRALVGQPDAVAYVRDQTGKLTKYLIETKYAHHDRRVSLESILPIVSTYQKLKETEEFGDHKLAIITNTNLTLKARRYCESLGIEIWRRPELLSFESCGSQKPDA